MASKVGDAFVEFSAKTSRFDSKMDSLRSRFKRRAAAMGRAALAAGKMIGAALAVGIGFAVRAYAKQEAAEKSLEAALRSHGDRVDKLLPKLKAEASAIQRVTTMGDEATLSLMAQIRNLGIQGDALVDATKGAIGLAAALDLDSNSAARYTALALQGEFTILQRYVPALRQATTAAEKQKIVMDLMNKGFEQAQIRATSVGKRMEQLRNAFGDTTEHIGRMITNTNSGDQALVVMTANIEQLNDALAQLGGGEGQTFFTAFKRRLQAMSAFVGAVAGGASLKEARMIVEETVRALDEDLQKRINEKNRAAGEGIKDLKDTVVNSEKEKQEAIEKTNEAQGKSASSFADIIRIAQASASGAMPHWASKPGASGPGGGGMNMDEAIPILKNIEKNTAENAAFSTA